MPSLKTLKKSWRKIIAEEKEHERMRINNPQMTLGFK